MKQNGVKNYAIPEWKLVYFLVTYSANYTILGTSTASVNGRPRQSLKTHTIQIFDNMGNSKAVYIQVSTTDD